MVAPLLREALYLPRLGDGDGHRVAELALKVKRANVDGDDGLVDVPMLPTHGWRPSLHGEPIHCVCESLSHLGAVFDVVHNVWV